jgi:hypothetical protein
MGSSEPVRSFGTTPSGGSDGGKPASAEGESGATGVAPPRAPGGELPHATKHKPRIGAAMRTRSDMEVSYRVTAMASRGSRRPPSAGLTWLASADRLRARMDLAKAKDQGKKWLIRIAIGGVLAIAASVALYVVFTLNFAYSKGERVGFVQKLSKRGWVCKTNEGELAMVNMAGQQATIFLFTVPDDKVVGEIESFAGHRVSLEYEEHRGIPSSCFGETSYFVTGVKKVE